MAEGLLAQMDDWGPEKVVCVSDSRTRMRGVLVLDNTARGMGKGGTRMSPTLDVEEVARLARTMTWKWAATDLFHGGAKAGILGDPNAPDKEAVLAERGVVVLPDFIANAGGVVAAAFAMDARYSPFRPDPEQIFTTVSSKLRANTSRVIEEGLSRGTTAHEAALALAQERVRAAMRLRGRLPRHAG